MHFMEMKKCRRKVRQMILNEIYSSDVFCININEAIRKGTCDERNYLLWSWSKFKRF